MRPKRNISIYKVGGGVLNAFTRFITFITAGILKTRPVQTDGTSVQVIVVSAFGEITAQIKEIINVLSTPEKDSAVLESLVLNIEHILANITGSKITSATSLGAAHYFNEFWELVSTLAKSTEVLSVYKQAELLQFGELISAQAMHSYLARTHRSVRVKYLDARDIIKTTGVNPLEDVVDFRATRKNFDNYFDKLVTQEGDTLLVVPGFIASVAETNKPSVLGFEGSDYTAAIFTDLALRSSLDFNLVELCYIKNVPGISLSFDENAQVNVFEKEIFWETLLILIQQGAKVLHPKVVMLLSQWKTLKVRVTSLESLTDVNYTGHKETIICSESN